MRLAALFSSKEQNMPSLMTEQQVSQQIQVSLAALRKWRVERRGPPFVKVGPLVRVPSMFDSSKVKVLFTT
jgi:hypothetical protein